MEERKPKYTPEEIDTFLGMIKKDDEMRKIALDAFSELVIGKGKKVASN